MKTLYQRMFGAAILSVFSMASLSAQATNKYAPLAYTPMSTYGQALVDMEVAKHPELKILSVHVTPRHVSPAVDKERRLMFSNIGRIGKVDNDEDGAVFRGGKEVVNIEKDPAPPSMNFSITATPKYEVMELLKDKTGKNVGLIVMVFPYHENFNLEAYHAIAKAVAAEVNSRVGSKDGLFKPAM